MHNVHANIVQVYHVCVYIAITHTDRYLHGVTGNFCRSKLEGLRPTVKYLPRPQVETSDIYLESSDLK